MYSSEFTFSPSCFTEISSPDDKYFASELERSKSESVPVILKITWFSEFTSTLPSIASYEYTKLYWWIPLYWEMISAIPVHPKNWVEFLLVYVIIWPSAYRIPDSPKPKVESTVILSTPIWTSMVFFANPLTTKSPTIESLLSLIK